MSQQESEATGPWVILLYGMARSPGSMKPLARLMFNRKVLEQVLHFLAGGRFAH